MNVDDYLRLTAYAISAGLIVWGLALHFRERGWRRFFYRWPIEFAPRVHSRATPHAFCVVLACLAALAFVAWCGLGAALFGTGQ